MYYDIQSTNALTKCKYPVEVELKTSYLSKLTSDHNEKCKHIPTPISGTQHGSSCKKPGLCTKRLGKRMTSLLM